jgi:hypothetical protein
MVCSLHITDDLVLLTSDLLCFHFILTVTANITNA